MLTDCVKSNYSSRYDLFLFLDVFLLFILNISRSFLMLFLRCGDLSKRDGVWITSFVPTRINLFFRFLEQGGKREFYCYGNIRLI